MDKEKATADEAPVIEQFGRVYSEQRQDWESFLMYIHKSCEDLLRGKIQASVTSRLKSWDSLRKKLERRHATKNYAHIEDIEDDELDIFGVRVRAYFPKQLPEIYKIIESSFTELKRKEFHSGWMKEDKLPAYSERFGNYEGIHYWVKLKPDDNKHPLERRLKERFENQAIEIQVRSSMLLDGWAEVRHDITYKALGGVPERAERELLDAMKGVIKSMEVLLDHLFDVHEDRIKSDHTKFETMELFEQAVVRAIPQLNLRRERIEDVQSLYHFMKATSIDTSGQFKEIIRKSHFASDFEDFQRKRRVSQQPIWTFILHQIFMTLSEKTITELADKIPESHRIFCRSISWLERNIFGRKQQEPLGLIEIERCNLIWNLHEYSCATWPKHNLEPSKLLGNLFSTIIKSPVPRIDMALLVAVTESLSGIQYHLQEAQLRDWPFFKSEELTFRWHQHRSFLDKVSIPGEPWQVRQSSVSANLLGIHTSQLHGAILFRGVCHENEETKIAIVKHLLSDIEDTDIEFANNEGLTTIHVATIFSPTIETVKLLLEAKADVNKADRGGETPLIAASALRNHDLRDLLLNEPGIDVNSRGQKSPEVRSIIELNAKHNDTLRLTCHVERSTVASCRKLECQYSTYRRSLAHWYLEAEEWSELEKIADYGGFAIVKSFGSWRQFLTCISGLQLTHSIWDIFWRNLAMTMNELDEVNCRLLGAVLRHPSLRSNRKFVDMLVKKGADASLPEPGAEYHMLAELLDREVLSVVLGSISPSRLMTKDECGRTTLHRVAREAFGPHSEDKLDTLLKTAGQDKFQTDFQGRTWIHYIVVSRLFVSVKDYLAKCRKEAPSDYERQLKARDDDGWTPLHWLCFRGFEGDINQSEWRDRLQFLLGCEADPDQLSKYGWTPRRILVLLKPYEFQECHQLLPPSKDCAPVESLRSSGMLRDFSWVYPSNFPHPCHGCLNITVSTNPVR